MKLPLPCAQRAPFGALRAAGNSFNVLEIFKMFATLPGTLGAPGLPLITLGFC